MRYRPEIDGLRALAVVGVIVYHMQASRLPGGFFGVDVFFVISGYLITGILDQSDKSSTWRFIGRFYDRRCRRILPALLLTLFVCLATSWILLLPSDLRRVGQGVIATALFSSNIFFWKTQDYFAPAASEQPLLHTWSLAVEEHFYVAFPFIVLAMSRLPRAWKLSLIGAMALASFLACIWADQHWPTANFYLLPSRMWEFLLGAAVALSGLDRAPEAPRVPKVPWQTPLPWAGLAMIAWGFVVCSDQTRSPNASTIVPTLGTALLIAFARADSLVTKLLSLRPLVFVGLISYSAYLVHQPLLAFLRLKGLATDSAVAQLAVMGTIAALAYLSWRFVEQPVRHQRTWPSSQVLLGSASLLLAAVAAGYMTQSHGMRQALQMGLRPEKLDADCLALRAPHSQCRYEAAAGNRPMVVLWGDSYADAFASSLGQALKLKGMGLHPLVLHSCPSLIGVVRHDDSAEAGKLARECESYSEQALRQIASLRPSHVVLTSAYHWYAQATNEADHRPILLDRDNPAVTDGRQTVLASLARTSAALNALGIRPLIVLPHPVMDEFSLALKKFGGGRPQPAQFPLDRRASNALRDDILARLKAQGVSFDPIDLSDLLCPSGGTCSAVAPSGKFMLYDGSHFSSVAAPLAAQRIVSAVN